MATQSDSQYDSKVNPAHLERSNSDDVEKREEHMVEDAAGQYVDPTVTISPEESEWHVIYV